MVLRLCAVSVDLDEIPHYRSLHGLPSSERAAGAVYERGLGRARAFALAAGVPLTLFAVGRDLERSVAAEQLAVLAEEGHRVENHSHTHRYDLTRLALPELRREVLDAHQAIEQAVGQAPQGFRAPGYTVCDELFEVLDELGYRFDSSVFPSPPYYGAKLLALATQRLRGRASCAILDTPRVLATPAQPYRPARPWVRPGGAGVLELPIQVTPLLRLPFIGTSLVLAGQRGARAMARSVAQQPFVNLELHGIDFLEAADGLEDLLPVQPDLRRALGPKLAALQGAVHELGRVGYRFVTLADAVTALG